MTMYYAGAKEMETLDTLAVENGLEIRQMMELAGWQMAVLSREMKIPKMSKIAIVVGKGNKGGDGLSAARHLVNHGWSASVIALSGRISPDAQHHFKLVSKMGIPIILYSANKSRARGLMQESDVLIDALIGYHLQGAPRGSFREVIELMNKSGGKIIAYDVPSGIDATSGACFKPCIRAYATLALALPKRAFRRQTAREACGKIYIADIGIPNFLYDSISRGSRPCFERFPTMLFPCFHS